MSRQLLGRAVPKARVAALIGSAILAGAAQPAFADFVGGLVAQVSVENITTHITALDYPRATPTAQAQASDYIVGVLESYGYTAVLDPVDTSANIIVRLEGTVTPERVFVLGAHFDSVAGSPGADDNASGVAGLLEIARILAGLHPDASIELVGFALEENGKVGSTHYAQAASTAGVDVIGMIAFEMIAYTCQSPGCQVAFADIPGCLDVEPAGVNVGNYIADLGNDASAALLGSFRDAAVSWVPTLVVGTAQVAGTGTCFSATRRSDHAPFWDRGYRALMITDTADYRNPNYHQPSDTLATLDLPFARLVTQATLATVVSEVGFSQVFADGFESGGSTAWSSTAP